LESISPKYPSLKKVKMSIKMGGENEILKLIKAEIKGKGNVETISGNTHLKEGYFYFAGKYISFPDIFYYDNNNSFLVEIKAPNSEEFNENLEEFSRAVEIDGLIDIENLISKIKDCCGPYPWSYFSPQDSKLAGFFIQAKPIHRNGNTLSEVEFTDFVYCCTLCLKNHYNNCKKGYFYTTVPDTFREYPPFILKIKNTQTRRVSYFNLASDGLSEAIAYALRLNTPEVWYTNMKTLYIVKNLREDIFQTLELESIQKYQLTLLYLDKPIKTVSISTETELKMDQKRQEIFDTIRKVAEEKKFLKDGENLDIKVLTISE